MGFASLAFIGCALRMLRAVPIGLPLIGVVVVLRSLFFTTDMSAGWKPALLGAIWHIRIVHGSPNFVSLNEQLLALVTLRVLALST